MKKCLQLSPLAGICRVAAFVLPLTLAAGSLQAETNGGAPALPPGACPLNSGGPSLLDTEWRLLSIYGNRLPQELEINMKVGEDSLSGIGGCNEYQANFKRVGLTGFMMTNVNKGREGCRVIPTVPGGPTINVGNWEGSYIRTLQRAGSVEQIGNTLHFYNRSGEPSIIFAKKFGDAEVGEPEAEPPEGETADAGSNS